MNFTPDKKPYKKLPPFKGWVLQNFPFIEADFDALNEYQMMCKVIEYLKVFQGNLDNMDDNVNSLYNAFVELQNYVNEYFDNLDVQEEINNKLDEMALDGTLQEIITQYINSTALWCFDTVSDMQSATNLINGSYAKTLGYYSINDGGESIYKITDTIPSTYYETLNNGLYAQLIAFNNINVEQFGAKGDGLTDDSTAIQNAILYNENNKSKINFSNKTYLCSGTIYLYSNKEFNLNNGIIKSNNFLRFINNEESVENNNYSAIENIQFINGKFDGNINGIEFALLHGNNIIFKNIIFKNCCKTSHVIDFGGCKQINIDNCIFDGYLKEDETIYTEMIQLDYATYNNMPYWSNPNTNYDNAPTKDIVINNCEFKKGDGINYPNAIGNHVSSYTPISNLTIKNCKFYDCTNNAIRLPYIENCNIINNEFYNINTSTRDKTPCIRFEYTYDHYTTYTPSLMSNNIKIMDNKVINNGNGDLTFVYARGHKTNSTNYTINDLLIENNIIDSHNENDDGVDIIDIDLTKNLTINNNTFNNAKNPIYLIETAVLENTLIINNRMNYCRDFIRQSGSYSNSVNNIIEQSNNIWRDDRGIININNFKCTLSRNASYTNDSGSATTTDLPLNTSSNPFITIVDNVITIPSFITRFKTSSVVTLKNPDDNTIRTLGVIVNYQENFRKTEVYGINQANKDLTMVNTNNYFEQYKYQFGNKLLYNKILLRNNDTINYSYSNYSTTNIIVEGY